jgi:hypothetical protein
MKNSKADHDNNIMTKRQLRIQNLTLVASIQMINATMENYVGVFLPVVMMMMVMMILTINAMVTMILILILMIIIMMTRRCDVDRT